MWLVWVVITLLATIQYSCPLCNQVYVNSHGAVAAILPGMQLLGLYPDEFEIVEWQIGTKFACSFQVDSESVKPTQEVVRATAH
jgi:hypothetical protein